MSIYSRQVLEKLHQNELGLVSLLQQLTDEIRTKNLAIDANLDMKYGNVSRVFPQEHFTLTETVPTAIAIGHYTVNPIRSYKLGIAISKSTSPKESTTVETLIKLSKFDEPLLMSKVTMKHSNAIKGLMELISRDYVPLYPKM